MGLPHLTISSWCVIVLSINQHWLVHYCIGRLNKGHLIALHGECGQYGTSQLRLVMSVWNFFAAFKSSHEDRVCEVWRWRSASVNRTSVPPCSVALGIDNKAPEFFTADWLPCRARSPTAGGWIISCSHRTVHEGTYSESSFTKNPKELKCS